MIEIYYLFGPCWFLVVGLPFADALAQRYKTAADDETWRQTSIRGD
jgi:hypothetical protein